MRDAQDAVAAGATQHPYCRELRRHAFGARLSATARYRSGDGRKARRGAKRQHQPAQPRDSSGQRRRPQSNPPSLHTPEAEAIKKEICAVGRKLWMRQFVDGNGGNISYRIGPNEVLCTPTLVSKYDLTPEDLCMVDLEGNQIAGTKPRTSETSAASGDLQSGAGGEVVRALPSAACDGLCHHRTRAAEPRDSGVRSFRGQGGDLALRNAGHAGVCRDRHAVREGTQHGAAGESRHRLLGRYRDPRRVVRRGAGDLLLDADAGVATWRARSRIFRSSKAPTCWPSRRAWACPIFASILRG